MYLRKENKQLTKLIDYIFERHRVQSKEIDRLASYDLLGRIENENRRKESGDILQFIEDEFDEECKQGR